ncbi:hypothetical protein GCM10009609_39770 [Pseudonocardia aurantiaca]
MAIADVGRRDRRDPRLPNWPRLFTLSLIKRLRGNQPPRHRVKRTRDEHGVWRWTPS